jgi:hypothetical protein
MTPTGFRALFPALERTVWLDTPGAPPGARTVTEALGAALTAWTTGEFAWADWDGAAAGTRRGDGGHRRAARGGGGCLSTCSPAAKNGDSLGRGRAGDRQPTRRDLVGVDDARPPRPP